MTGLKNRLSLAAASLAAASLAAVMLAVPAQADYLFSGSGPSGALVAPSETWVFSADQGSDWGSPGVGLGVVAYGETLSAFGMTLTFTGDGRIGTINSASVGIGNGSACVGGSTGGTTFCTISPTDIWLATITGPELD